jgi:dihydrofolate synthase / folylpolyglutamate synthase
VQAVLERMQLRRPPFAVITVSGTNGKGSTVGMLEAILAAAGYRVGAYTSPHLIRYNERIRLAGRPATDVELCAAFARIESARGEVRLTYFEFGTVAALDLMTRAGVDVAVLEVGMGGRLDAVNAVDADVAVVTAIDIDHTQWLGTTRAAIAREKAGIFRPGRPAICGDADPPETLVQHAREIGARLLVRERDYSARPDLAHPDTWTWRCGTALRTGLPLPALRGDYQLDNAAGVLAALEMLGERLPVSQANVRQGLMAAAVPGRFQVLPGRPVRVLDVAHNPQAARALAATLRRQGSFRETRAVFGMLADKDIGSVVEALRDDVDRWYVTTLHTARGADSAQIAAALAGIGVTAPVTRFERATDAWTAALADADASDRVVVFGSFHTVGDILAALGESR